MQIKFFGPGRVNLSQTTLVSPLDLDSAKVKTLAEECGKEFGNVSVEDFEDKISQIKAFEQEYPGSIKIGFLSEERFFVIALTERVGKVPMMVDFFSLLFDELYCDDITFSDEENAFFFWWD